MIGFGDYLNHRTPAGPPIQQGSNQIDSGGVTGDNSQSYVAGETSNQAVSGGYDGPVGDQGYDYGYGNPDQGYTDQGYTDYGGSDFSSYDSYAPVILNLDGNGIQVTPVTSSNTYYDMAGDGRQHRTAWAAAGNAVLVYDTNGDGQITQKNQVVFTEWDPTATSDLQAIQDVFDTNLNVTTTTSANGLARTAATDSDVTTSRLGLPSFFQSKSRSRRQWSDHAAQANRFY